jgi:hypothetical protein
MLHNADLLQNFLKIRNELLAKALISVLLLEDEKSIYFVSNLGSGFPVIDNDYEDNRYSEMNYYRNLRPQQNKELFSLCMECGLEERVSNCGLRNIIFILGGGDNSLECMVVNKTVREIIVILNTKYLNCGE